MKLKATEKLERNDPIPHLSRKLPRCVSEGRAELPSGSEVDQAIAILLQAHPECRPAFRTTNLTKMSEPDKLLLLTDVKAAIGIIPLRSASR